MFNFFHLHFSVTCYLFVMRNVGLEVRMSQRVHVRHAYSSHLVLSVTHFVPLSHMIWTPTVSIASLKMKSKCWICGVNISLNYWLYNKISIFYHYFLLMKCMFNNQLTDIIFNEFFIPYFHSVACNKMFLCYCINDFWQCGDDYKKEDKYLQQSAFSIYFSFRRSQGALIPCSLRRPRKKFLSQRRITLL